jgi:preprotein translocase subunit SecF
MGSKDSFESIKNMLQSRRFELKRINQRLQRLEPDSYEFKRLSKNMFKIQTDTLSLIITLLQNMVIAQVGLKNQIDFVKDILVQLHEVRENPQMMSDIKERFKQYNDDFFRDYAISLEK